jgi:hypothetical protein
MKLNLPYITLRLIRHFMPHSAVRFLLDNQLIIRPGLETRAPQAALDRYLQALEEIQFSIENKHILVFGYGGTFTIGCAFLEAGARHVTLLDRYVKPNNQQNLALLPLYGEYLEQDDGNVIPRSTYLRVVDGDVREVAANKQIPPVDFVVSSSVFEHLDDVDGITRSLAMLTKPDGVHLHFIDLRDHFFKYPFEMLTYSEETWQKWLNPTSNLNRYRLPDYQRVFQKYFAAPKFSILDRNLEAFLVTEDRIRPEFLTGDSDIDAITTLQVLAQSPRDINLISS